MTKGTQVIQGLVIVVIGQIGLMLADSKPHLSVVLILAIGAILFAYGLRGYSTFVDKWVAEGRIDSAKVVFGRGQDLLFLAIGLAALLILVVRLARGSSAPGDVFLWAIGIGAFTVPFVSQARLPGRSWRPYWREIAFVLALMALFLILNARDLTDWYYSAIGDEYAFFNGANGIINNGLERAFSQRGVYNKQPVLNSGYQALVMLIFGRDNFGWKMSSVLSIVIAIPGIYVLARALANRKVAVIATMLFSLSHYLFAYAHIGYNNIHPIAPTVWSLACFVLGLQKRNALLLYAAGLAAGLGFYTYYSARAIVPIITLFVITDSVWRKRLRELWPFGLGFVITAAMIFIVSKAEVLTRMLAEVPGGYSEAVTGGALERIMTNASQNLLAFNVNLDQMHYVSGSLLDPVSAVLAVLGAGLALVNLRSASYRLVLIWVAVGLAATGILSPYPKVAISRLNYVVPALAILAGLAAIGIWDAVLLRRSKKLRPWVGPLATAVLFLVVLALNARQFWIETPKLFVLTREAITIGAMRSDECAGDSEDVIVVDAKGEALLKPALTTYLPEDTLPQIVGPAELNSLQELQAGSVRCVIFSNPKDEMARQAVQELQRTHPAWETVQFSSPSGNDSVLILVARL